MNKPLTVQPGYKWGRADALGIGDDNECYLVTTGLGGGVDRQVAEAAVKAINNHGALVAALIAVEAALNRAPETAETLFADALEIIEQTLANVEAAP
jgi:hypothetical protein